MNNKISIPNKPTNEIEMLSLDKEDIYECIKEIRKGNVSLFIFKDVVLMSRDNYEIITRT